MRKIIGSLFAILYTYAACAEICDAGHYWSSSENKCKLCIENYYCPGDVIDHARYTVLEYLQATGDQYIDTNFSDYETRFVFRASWDYKNEGFAVASHNANAPYGRNGVFYYDGWGGGHAIEVGYGDIVDRTIYPSGRLNVFYDIDHSTLGGKCNVYINNEHVAHITETQPISQSTVKLFTSDYNIAHPNQFKHMRGKTSYVKIYNHDNILVRDFIPVYDKIDDVYGMYDLVTNTLFTNLGTGQFIGGPEIYTNPVECVVATNGVAPYSPPGSISVADCGLKLHINDKILYMRSEKRTSPSLCVKMYNNLFYGDMTTDTRGFLRVKYNDVTYSVYNQLVD